MQTQRMPHSEGKDDDQLRCLNAEIHDKDREGNDNLNLIFYFFSFLGIRRCRSESPAPMQMHSLPSSLLHGVVLLIDDRLLHHRQAHRGPNGQSSNLSTPSPALRYSISGPPPPGAPWRLIWRALSSSSHSRKLLVIPALLLMLLRRTR